MHDYGGRIRPSYGTGDNGIKWQPDPFGGSGDIATIFNIIQMVVVRTLD